MNTPDREPEVSWKGHVLALFLLLSYLGITAFISATVVPMVRLFFLDAPDGLSSYLSGGWSTALGLGLLGIVLLILSVSSKDRIRQVAFGVFAWLLLLASALVLVGGSKHIFLTSLTAIPFTCASIAWLVRLTKLTLSQGPHTPPGTTPDPTYSDHFNADPRKPGTEQVTERDGTTERSP
jgi:predicted membrane channel-forming protein YqfA (hemolysin III family)